MATLTTTKMAPHAGRTWWRQGLLGCGIVSSVLYVASGLLVATQVGQLAAIQPTPWMGLEERVSSYGMMLWTALLAVGLLRAGSTTALRQLEQPTVTRQPLAR